MVEEKPGGSWRGRPYATAVVCYLAIPVVVIGGVALSRLIDPELALRTANYGRNFRLLEMVRQGVLLSAAGLAVVLWATACYLVLRSRQRSPLWLLLAAAGPFGFVFIAMLGDRSAAPGDAYQRFISKLRVYWRLPLEVAKFFAAWCIAFSTVFVKRDLMNSYESFSTGRSVEEIVAEQTASSGMYAFGEGLEATYLFILIYLLWPLAFNLAARYKSSTFLRQERLL
jgi:hypothetical protein